MMSQRHVAIPSRGAARLRFRTALAVSLSAAALALSAAAPGAAATLKVGPGQKYAKPSAAFQAAGSGDVIEINAAGDYGGDVATIARDKLTVRGVGRGRVKIPAKGRIEGGKAIWVIRGHYVTVENIEFSGARAPDRNGAGIRAEGQGLTVRRCRFYDCQDGILGGAGEMLIEYSEFDHCGLVAEPATHSCYIGERCTKLAFHGNYSTRVVQGHLLKSRARENWVLYNRLTDETGTGSAVADFPNGGVVVMAGNILDKGPKAQNNRVVAYGMEGLKYQRNALYVVNNTMYYELHRPSFFVRVENAPPGFTPVIYNNLCIGTIPLCNLADAEAKNNLIFAKPSMVRVVNAAAYDFRLTARSPCIDKGVDPGKADGIDLAPRFQYVHPCQREIRPVRGPLDVRRL